MSELAAQEDENYQQLMQADLAAQKIELATGKRPPPDFSPRELTLELNASESSRTTALSWTAMVRALACTAIAAAVGAGFALTASGTPAARCQPTVSDTPGPFQQGGVNAPRRAKIGTGHVLQGRVVRAPDCAPVARAVVVLWQAGPNGYRPNGRGSVRTDRAGRFRFEGPVPAGYGRGPHIHMAVLHPEYEELASRYGVRRGAKTGRIRLVLTPLL